MSMTTMRKWLIWAAITGAVVALAELAEAYVLPRPRPALHRLPLIDPASSIEAQRAVIRESRVLLDADHRSMSEYLTR
jgi:hypothetical protein